MFGEKPGQHWPDRPMAAHRAWRRQSPGVDGRGVGCTDGSPVAASVNEASEGTGLGTADGTSVGASDVGASVLSQQPKWTIAPVVGEMPGQHWPESCMARQRACARQSPAVVGDADGAGEGDADGRGDGLVDGESLGLAEGLVLGDTEGDADGLADGTAEGDTEGTADGDVEGAADGLADGAADGDREGAALGLPLGLADGLREGLAVGAAVHGSARPASSFCVPAAHGTGAVEPRGQ